MMAAQIRAAYGAGEGARLGGRPSLSPAPTPRPVLYCLNCGQRVHVVIGQVLDSWGQPICGATAGPHSPDLPQPSGGAS